MPAEERVIHFDLGEVYQALQIGCINEKKDPIPEGDLTKIEIDEEGTVEGGTITLHIANDGKDETVEYDRQFFGVSLVFYCRGHNIPIPARGNKVLNINPDKISMLITLDRTAEAA